MKDLGQKQGDKIGMRHPSIGSTATTTSINHHIDRIALCHSLSLLLHFIAIYHVHLL
jgi:hypothetical protein